MIKISNKKALYDSDFLAILPDRLYKYRNWGAPHGRELLENLWLFYAYTALFEDENDCHPIITDPTIQDLFNYSKRINPNLSDLQHQNNVRQLWDRYYNTDVKERHERNFRFERIHDDYYGVLCLSLRSTNGRLWHDNSCDHNGYCVEFISRELIKHIPIGSAGLVEYRNSIPRIPFGDFSVEMARLTYFAKTHNYETEEEFRIMKHYNHRLSIAERNVVIPVECVNRIFVDSQMNPRFIEEIHQIVDGRWEIIQLQL